MNTALARLLTCLLLTAAIAGHAQSSSDLGFSSQPGMRQSASGSRPSEEQSAREAKQRQDQEQRDRAQTETEAKKNAAARAWQRQRDALTGRFPTIAVGETKTPALESAGGKLKPAIHYLKHDQRSKLRVEVTSSNFVPLLSIYELDKEAPLASAEGAAGSPARLSVSTTGDTNHYVVVVYSVDGKRGPYALKVERE